MNTKLKTVSTQALLLVCCLGLAFAWNALAAEDSSNPVPPQEDSLIAVLQQSADWQAKQDACRGLRRVGTEKSIPALAALLGDEQFAHLARFALEAMPCPQADQALRDALPKVSDKMKTGIVISMGVRRDAQAVPLLTPLLLGANEDMVRATLGALGRIADDAAIAALQDVQKFAAPEIRPALGEALLAAAEHRNKDQKKDQALAIYTALLSKDWPTQVRTGAFRGQVLVEPAYSVERLTTALKGDEPLFRAMAAQLGAELPAADATKQLAALLPELPATGQAALMEGLAVRGDKEAYPAVAAMLNNADPAVQRAAVQAIGVLGSAGDVRTLVGLLRAADAGVADAARSALDGMNDDQVNTGILSELPGVAPEIQVVLLQTLASRRAAQGPSAALLCLGGASTPEVRLASLQVLSQLGGKDELPLIIPLMKQAPTPEERNAAEQTLGVLCTRNSADALPWIKEGMKDASVEAQSALVRMLARIRSTEALQELLGLIKDPAAPLYAEACRELAAWPTLEAAPQLLEWARNGDATQKPAGLQGYVRLARTEPDPAKKAEMLNTAMTLAQSKEDRWMVLAAWATLTNKQSLDTLASFLDNAEVRNEAAAAIITVSAAMGKAGGESRTQALQALQTVIDRVEDPAIRERAGQTKARF